jgi:agmatine deiminase
MKPFPLFALLISCLFFTQCADKQVESSSSDPSFYYDQGNLPRLAAEWEPALGTVLSWPLSVPHKLVIELARDYGLFVMVENDSTQADAVGWFLKWEMDTSRVQFIQAPQGVDASWLRDWGPHAVFASDGTFSLANPNYINSTPISGMGCEDSLHFLFMKTDPDGARVVDPTTAENNAPEYIAKALKVPAVNLPFVFTGGNIMTDGLGNAISTCIIVNENKFNGMSKTDFMQSANDLLGIRKYDIIPNFEPRGIQHIDCYLKILDENRLFVVRPPDGHPERLVYDSIVDNELSKLKNVYGRPYEILRLDTDRYEGEKLAAYTNSIIINQHIYVPLFGIAQDSIALQQWRAAMPGYTVKGFEFVIADEPALSVKARSYYTNIGWTFGDALHCRTRAIWDPEMLFISVNRESTVSSKKKEFNIHATVIDYSSSTLTPESVELHFRAKGKTDWITKTMIKDGSDQWYAGSIPLENSGSIIEYYITATSSSGKKASRPATAPDGYFEVEVE